VHVVSHGSKQIGEAACKFLLQLLGQLQILAGVTLRPMANDGDTLIVDLIHSISCCEIDGFPYKS
jgi:hypothetical protein